MQAPKFLMADGQTHTPEANNAFRNTDPLLSMTLLFSALVAGTATVLNLPHPDIIITLAVYFGLIFLTTKFRNNSTGVLCVFALTGFMGYALVPMINAYLNMSNGPQLVMTSMGASGAVFLGLSAIMFKFPALLFAVSAMFLLLMSGLILCQSSDTIRGGETNYIVATVTLYVAIFNLFDNLVHLLGSMNAKKGTPPCTIQVGLLMSR